MIAATPIDWDAVTVAASFVLGAITGTIATIAVMRSVISYLRRDP